ncbi:MAG: hypothetical protein ACM3SR_12365 [Ignavibacteriales bacterium]
MTLSFFSCSRSVLLCSIIIFGVFFLFGQISITHAATPVPPNPTYPPNTWTNTIPSGSITFQWSYTGDTTNIWFYFFMYKWDFQQGKWVVVASEYAKTNTYDTQFLADGYYAWRVAAVDILQQDPNNWYQWNTDWVKLQLLTTVIPTAVPTFTYTATPTPAESPTPTSTPCPGTCPTYYISPTGSNSNNGTSVSTPWKTFAYAIPKLQPGDTLKLLNGTYLVSDSGMINIDCKVNAKNGLLSSPITIQAQNERQAFVWGDGITPSVRMNNCSYWNIIGLHLEARDNEAVTNNSSAVMDLNYDTHANVKRIVLAHNNRMALGSISLITSGNLSDVLFEDNEFYYFRRYGLGSNPSNHIVLRRNYFNATGYCDITAAGQPLYPSGTSTRAGRQAVQCATEMADSISMNQAIALLKIILANIPWVFGVGIIILEP